MKESSSIEKQLISEHELKSSHAKQVTNNRCSTRVCLGSQKKYLSLERSFQEAFLSIFCNAT